MFPFKKKTDFLDTMIHLVDLPDVSLKYIFGYLTAADVFNLRLTCHKMFQTSKCKEFYEKVQIRMTKIKNTDRKLFQKLCDEFAFNLRFNTEGCFEDRIAWILPNVKNVKDILVNVKYLKQACEKVRHIRHLVINYIKTDNLLDKDIDFSCLSIAKELNELIIKGTNNGFRKLYMYRSMVYDIVKNTKQLSKICFDSLSLGEGIRCIEGKDVHSKKIRESNHISEWHLKNVMVKDGIFDLPEDMRVLEWRYTNGISFPNLSFDRLEKLVLEGVISDNLNILEIADDLFGHGFDGKAVIRPKLEIFRLFGIHHIEIFLHLLISGLKMLHISVIHDISNTEIHWILRNEPSIKKCIKVEIYDRKQHNYLTLTEQGRAGENSKSSFEGKLKVTIFGYSRSFK